MSRDLRLVVISLFTWGIGEGMFIYFQPLYLQQWGADPLEIGGILGAAGIAMALSLIPAGYLADRFGARPLMWASWGIGALATWSMALSGSLTVFAASLVVYWLTSFGVPPMNSYITHAAGRWSVGRALSVCSGAFQLGGVIGPLAGGWLGQTFGLRSVYFAAGTVMLVSLTTVLFIHRQPAAHSLPVESDGRLLHNRRFLGFVAVAAVVMFATYLPQSLTPNFLQNQRGLTLAEIGGLGSIGSLGNAVLVLGLGQLHAPLAFLIGQAAVIVFALGLWRGSGYAAYAIAYFFYGGSRLCRVMATALARPLVRRREVSLAYGILETANASTVILAPPLAGALYTLQPALLYMVTLGAVAVSLAVTGTYLTVTRRKDNPGGMDDA